MLPNSRLWSPAKGPSPRVRTPTGRPLALMLLSSLAIAAGMASARAQTCAAEAVAARGENAKFSWSAKMKARANWRRKVRAMPGLGPDYADWNKAADGEERCLSGPAGTLCFVTGTPCRP